MDSTDLGAPAATSRRGLFGLLGVGGAVAALPLLARSAAAQEGGSTPPPKRPTADDLVLLRFAQTVELAAREAYALTVARPDLDDNQRAIAQTFHDRHLSYAESLGGLIGRSAPGVANAALLDALADRFTGGSVDDALLAAHDLERDAVATHTELLGALEGLDGATLVASIVSAEARHSAALAGILGVDVAGQIIPDGATPLSPDDYPVE